MSDHEFEKQVRQKLNDLKLTPSAVAWENIEETLRRSKRRRTPVLWLPVILASLFAGGYFMYNSPGKLLPPKGERHTNGHEQGKANITTNDTSFPGINALSGSDIHQGKNDVSLHEGSLTRIRSSSSPFLASLTTSGNTFDGESNTEGNILANDNDNKKEDSVISYPGQLEKNKPAANSVLAEKMDSSTATQSDSSSLITPHTVAKKKNKGWLFAINAYSGIASYNPSAASPAFAWSAGGLIKYKLSKRFSLSAGLSYTQFNTHTKTGLRVNGSQLFVPNTIRRGVYVQNYALYQPPEEKIYNNRYHFIELPITLYARINKGEKLPVYWNAGVILSRLINSKSIHIEGSEATLVTNDKWLNKSQVGVATGFSFELFNKSATPLWIGPSARAHISSVMKKDISPAKNFVSLGLDVKWFFRK